MILYRPVGLKEMELIFDSKCEAFPPRLSNQPIFYPVLNVDYATQIAKEWNTKSDDNVGYVTQFQVDDKFLKKYEPKIVGNSIHKELWIPSEDLADFNKSIIAKIEIVSAYYGKNYKGYIPNTGTNISSKDVIQQLITLDKLFSYNPVDFMLEVTVNKKAVFLNYHYWLSKDYYNFGFSTNEQKEKIIESIQKVWNQFSQDCSLFVINA